MFTLGCIVCICMCVYLYVRNHLSVPVWYLYPRYRSVCTHKKAQLVQPEPNFEIIHLFSSLPGTCPPPHLLALLLFLFLALFLFLFPCSRCRFCFLRLFLGIGSCLFCVFFCLTFVLQCLQTSGNTIQPLLFVPIF